MIMDQEYHCLIKTEFLNAFLEWIGHEKKETGGTGLGLAIVKHLVEGFGGKVGVLSNKDGTSFWATLPLKNK